MGCPVATTTQPCWPRKHRPCGTWHRLFLRTSGLASKSTAWLRYSLLLLCGFVHGEWVERATERSSWPSTDILCPPTNTAVLSCATRWVGGYTSSSQARSSLAKPTSHLLKMALGC